MILDSRCSLHAEHTFKKKNPFTEQFVGMSIMYQLFNQNNTMYCSIYAVY